MFPLTFNVVLLLPSLLSLYSGTFGFTYQQLCAKKLSFCHPITGVPMVLESRMDVEL
jgi:hypothetical protein